MSAMMSRYLTRKKNGELNPHEDKIVLGSCIQFKKLANQSYKRIKVWPKKSAVVKMSKLCMNGELDWVIDDIPDIVGLAKDRKGKPPFSVEAQRKEAV